MVLFGVLWSLVFFWFCEQTKARSVSLDAQLIPHLEVPGTYVYRHFYSWDYPSRFNLSYLGCMLIDPDVKEWVLDTNPLEQMEEEFVVENEKIWKSNLNIYSKLCKQQEPYEVQELNETPKVYIRWVNSLVKWGLFAEESILPNTTIGLYAGFLNNKTTNFDYSWEYNVYTQVYDKDDEPVYLAVDALESGNHLRFVNHNEESINVSPIYAVRDNAWWIFYVSTKFIDINQQLLTDYGKAYWESEEDEVQDHDTSEDKEQAEFF